MIFSLIRHCKEVNAETRVGYQCQNGQNVAFCPTCSKQMDGRSFSASSGLYTFNNDTFLRSIYFSSVNYVYCHKKFIIQATGQTRHEDVLPWMRIASGKQDIIFAFIVFLSDLTMMTSSSGNHFLSLTSPETFLSITFENYLRRIFIPLSTALTRKKWAHEPNFSD